MSTLTFTDRRRRMFQFSSRSRRRKSLVARVGVFFAVVAGLFTLGSGCDGGREGERCNPLLSHDECGGGLSCQQPSTCAENYCCPSPSTSSNDPYCNGTGCPAPDAGAAGAVESGIDDGGDASTPLDTGTQ